MLKKISDSSFTKITKPFNEDSPNIHMQNYNSFDVPENFYDIKRYNNQVFD